MIPASFYKYQIETLMLAWKSTKEPSYQLNTQQIHIFQFSLNDYSQEFLTILDNEERTRVERLIFEKHRRRFIVARVRLRQILGRYLDLNPMLVTIDYGPHGKPYIKSQLDIEFNLSHSGTLGLCAVGQNAPLGIDIEQFTVRPFQGIADNLFSSQEAAALMIAPNSAKPLFFFNIWAQKEALIKACGLGLSYPTKTFTTSPITPNNHQIYDPLHNKYWQMHTFMPRLGYFAAVCYDATVVQELYFYTI